MRRIAAHEADARPLDARAERQPIDQSEVEPGAAKPVQDTTTRCVMPSQIVVEVDRRPEREIGGALLVDPHARAGVRERPVTIEPGIVELPGPGAGREHRVPALDAAALRHAPEQPAVARVAEQTRRVVGEEAVHLVCRDGGPDRVQISPARLQEVSPHPLRKQRPRRCCSVLDPVVPHDLDHLIYRPKAFRPIQVARGARSAEAPRAPRRRR